MRLTWHIVRKDLHRLRWVIRVWALLTAAQFLFARVFSGTGAMEFFALTWGLNVVLPTLFVGLLLGLHDDDSVADRDSFWVTRPISSGQLLAAKGISVALLLLIPLGAGLVWWMYHDFTVAQMARAAWATVVWHAALALVFAPLIAITRGPKQFFLAILVAAAIGVILYFLANWLSPITQISEAAQRTRGWVVIVVCVASTAAVLLVQYRTGRRQLSILVILLGLLVGFIGWTRWVFEPAPPREFASPEMLAEIQKLAGRWERVARDRNAAPLNFEFNGKEWRSQVLFAVPPREETGNVVNGRGLEVLSVIDNAPAGPMLTLTETKTNYRSPVHRLLFPNEDERHGSTSSHWFHGQLRESGLPWTNSFLLGADGRLLWPSRPRGERELEVTVGCVSMVTRSKGFAPARITQDKLPDDVQEWLKTAELRVVQMGPVNVR